MKKKRRRTSPKPPVNRCHKDRLFRFAFQDRRDLLELYNAVNGTSYADPDLLEITTLEDALFLGMKNDISFIIGADMNLYEHQGSRCGNMPLRGLIYFSTLYQNHVKRYGYNLYGSRRIELPFPNYIVFYNGSADEPDETVLSLSDAFQKNGREIPPAVECRVRVLNINRGHSRELMERCQRLREYAEFIGFINDYLREGLTVRDAIRKAMDACQDQGILSDLLGRCRTEVLDMLLAEYNEKETMDYIRREEREIGREEGHKEGRKEGEQIGISKGRRMGKASVILDFLEETGPVPESLRVQILSEQSEDRLRAWCRLASHVQSAQEFLEKYQEA